MDEETKGQLDVIARAVERKLITLREALAMAHGYGSAQGSVRAAAEARQILDSSDAAVRAMLAAAQSSRSAGRP